MSACVARARSSLLATKHLQRNCMYCGERADNVEHVFPKTYFGEQTQKVWACSECNGLAGAKIFDSILEKRSYIQERLRWRYRGFLEMPDWCQEEMDELGPSMLTEIKKGMRIKRWIVKRLNYQKNPVALVAEKILEKSDTGKNIAQKIAELDSTQLNELRLLLTSEKIESVLASEL